MTTPTAPELLAIPSSSRFPSSIFSKTVGHPFRLQRVISSGRWLPEIDGLRFLAIGSVLLVHIFNQCFNGHGGMSIPQFSVPFASELEHLGRGVQLFFIISGFVLARPFLRHYQDGGEPVVLKDFYKRRLTRLEPPYILSLVLYSVALILFRHNKPQIVIPSALTSLFYVHNLIPRFPPVNNPTWSLEVEVQFYLLTPLLAGVYAIRNAILRRGALLLASVLSVLLSHPSHHGFFLPSQIVFFLIGFLLADLRVLDQRNRSYIWDAVGLILWGAVFLMPEAWGYGPLGLLLALAFTLSLRGILLRTFLSTRWVALLGGMCYSLYLTHMLVLSFVFSITNRAMIFHNAWINCITQMMLILPFILLFGTMYYLVIEQPCMRSDWPERLSNDLQNYFRGRVLEN